MTLCKRNIQVSSKYPSPSTIKRFTAFITAGLKILSHNSACIIQRLSKYFHLSLHCNGQTVSLLNIVEVSARLTDLMMTRYLHFVCFKPISAQFLTQGLLCKSALLFIRLIFIISFLLLQYQFPLILFLFLGLVMLFSFLHTLSMQAHSISSIGKQQCPKTRVFCLPGLKQITPSK